MDGSSESLNRGVYIGRPGELRNPDNIPGAVVGIGLAAEHNRRVVNLRLTIDESSQTRGLTDEEHEQTGGKRIEGPGVTDPTNT
jgi:hypothetical protein